MINVFRRNGGRRTTTKLLAIGAAALLTIASIPIVQAIHEASDPFELDKNALDADDTVDPRDDWEDIFNGTDSATITTDQAGNGIVEDPFGTTIYTTGGSKDDLDIPSWRHKTGSVPPKDEITNAYAAIYEGATTQLYFGADRFANNGSAQIGFWFFQSAVTLDTATGEFVGEHVATGPGGNGVFCGDAANGPTCTPKDADDTPGDILILSDFTNGGAISVIRAFEWVGVDGTATSNGTLELIDIGVDCENAGPHPAFPEFCGTVNGPEGAASDGTDAPWPFTPKFGTDGFFPFGSFYEGGIDLTAYGFGGVCFSSFLAETRSSPSVDATLKDFVLGQFPGCTGGISTTPSNASVTVGTAVHDTATVTTSGVGAPAPQGSVTFYVCGPLAAGVLCSTAGTQLGSPVALNGTSNPAVVDSADFTPTSPGRYCFGATWTGDPNFDDASDFRETECFTAVTIPTTISTAQSWIPNDSATITTTGPAGYNLTGSVVFSLYNTSTCGGSVLYTETRTMPAGAGLSETLSTTNGDGVPSDFVVNIGNDATFSWLVVYTPDALDTAHTGSTSVCHDEHSLVTITDDDPNIPAP